MVQEISAFIIAISPIVILKNKYNFAISYYKQYLCDIITLRIFTDQCSYNMWTLDNIRSMNRVLASQHEYIVCHFTFKSISYF